MTGARKIERQQDDLPVILKKVLGTTYDVRASLTSCFRRADSNSEAGCAAVHFIPGTRRNCFYLCGSVRRKHRRLRLDSLGFILIVQWGPFSC